MIVQIAYTNSKCSDIWEMFVKENQKHTKMPLCMISDKLPNDFHGNILLYKNEEPYYEVWINAVKNFGNNYFIYLQEDFILYNDVNETKIEEYVEFLKNNPKYSFVRLLKSENFHNKKLSSTLYEVESFNINAFAMQPTIWRTSDYIMLLNLVQSKVWYDEDSYRNKMNDLNMMGAYHYDGEKKAGRSHYDSNVYPYIATALVRGKWNMSEYNIQLNKLINEYNININKRGII
jgi:hypothetical protein